MLQFHSGYSVNHNYTSSYVDLYMYGHFSEMIEPIQITHQSLIV